MKKWDVKLLFLDMDTEFEIHNVRCKNHNCSYYRTEFKIDLDLLINYD